MPETPEKALERLLKELFGVEQLRRFLVGLPGGAALLDELPGGSASSAEVIHQAVTELKRNGMADQEFFEALLVAKPKQAARIRETAAAWKVPLPEVAEVTPRTMAPSAALSRPGPAATQTIINHGPVGQQFNFQGGAHTFNLGTSVTPRAAETTRMKILFLAANPSDTGRLALDQEIRGIRERLQMSELRDRFELVSAWAVRAGDLRQELLAHKPAIVHFAGHGTPEGLILEGQTGTRQRIPSSALASLFGLFTAHVQCVVLNACYSDDQAEAIAQQIPVVVGMKGPVVDRAGVLFADGLYQAIGHDRTIEDAVALGRAAYELEGITATAEPQIKTKAGVNAATYVIRPPV